MSDFKFGQRAGIRQAVTWLHKRAREMNDPHATVILNSAAFLLGVEMAHASPLPPSEERSDTTPPLVDRGA